MQQLALGVQLREHARFSTFVAGPNGAALAALQRLATLPTSGRGAAGVCWLAGPAGSGKTHLLHAFCAAVDPGARVGFLAASDLEAAPAELWRAWVGLDALCIDDLNAVVGVPAVEGALFALYRDVEERGAALVVTSSQPPTALHWSLADIASRFAAASLYVLRPLDDADRMQALLRHASARGLDLPEDAARYLMLRVPRDLQSLCAALDRLDLAALQAQRRLTLPFIREVLEPQG